MGHNGLSVIRYPIHRIHGMADFPEYWIIDWLGIVTMVTRKPVLAKEVLMKNRTKYYLRLARKYGPWIIPLLRFMKLVAELMSETPNYARRKLSYSLRDQAW